MGLGGNLLQHGAQRRGQAPQRLQAGAVGAELAAYRTRLQSLRGLPATLRVVLEQIPAEAHPMDVLRTGCSVLGNLEPERLPATGPNAGSVPGARAIGDRLLACFPSMLLYWHHYSRTKKRIEVETTAPSL